MDSLPFSLPPPTLPARKKPLPPLPDELLVEVFLAADNISLCKLQRVCWKFRRILKAS